MVGKGEVDGSRTAECLRGRLLAERVASKVAREDAELLTKRLNEVERLLAMEIEARNRAEKRLRGILKKLESSKVLDVSGLSNVSETSASSSPPCFTSLRDPEEGKTSPQSQESTLLDADGKAKEMQNLPAWDDSGAESSGSTSPVGSADQPVSHEGSWASVGTCHSQNNSDPSGEGTEEIKGCLKSMGNGELRAMLNPVPGQEDTTSEAATGAEGPGDARQQINDADDDRLALVPVGIWDGSETAPELLSSSSSNVEGVLDSLRRVRVQLQDMVGRRTASPSKELCGR